MSDTIEAASLQVFAERLVEELKFYGDNSGNGQVTGEQVVEATMDIIQIDLRRRDVISVIEGLPNELRCFLMSAYRSPKTQWAMHRQLEMVKRVGATFG